MEIKVETINSVVVVTPVGEIDALTASDFAAFLNRQLSDGKHQLVADLSLVGYMSSAGLRSLLATLKDARQRGGDFRLAALQSGVRQVLDMTGFSGIFKHFPTQDAAVTSFSGKG
jgi:anti-anti-sigma factor